MIIDISTVATADPHRVMVKYDEVSILDIMVGADAANGAYFMLDFSSGPAWGGTVTTVSTPSLDLSPATPGNNFNSSSCGAAVRPITSGSASQSLTGSSNTENQRLLLKAEESRFSVGESSMFLVNARENNLIAATQKLIDLKAKFFKSIIGVQWAMGQLR